VPHEDDAEYHFVYLPSVINSAKVYWMSANDDVIGTFQTVGNALPTMSMTEQNGLLYGVTDNRIGELGYDGSIHWLLQLPFGSPAHHLYEIQAHGNALYVRYQFDVGADRRPALAVFDTTGQLQHDLIWDITGTGTPSECRTVLLGNDIVISAQRTSTFDLLLIRMDTALTTWSIWTDDRPYSNLFDCERSGSGIVLSGLNSQNSHGFFSRSGPGGAFAACWTELPADTLLRTWPALSPVTQNTATFDPLLVQTTVVPMPHVHAASTDCIALARPDPPFAEEGSPVITVDGETIAITPPNGTDVMNASLFDVTGRMIWSGSPGARMALEAPISGCYVLVLRTACGGSSVMRLVIPR
jgi:hypothetical protein